MKIIFSLVTILVFGLAGFYLILYLIEDRMIYYPVKFPNGYWKTTGLPLQDCYFKTEDGLKLHGWFLPASGANRTLLWLHGNAGNISHRLDNIKRFAGHGFQLFIFDYRGYGRSAGKPSEKGLYLDAQAAFDFLVKKKKLLPENIVIFGRSLGGGAATDLALQRPAAGLILESTFTSVGQIAREMFPILPSTRVIKNQFNSLEKVKKLKMPLLIIHGKQDDLIPFHHGETLFQQAPEPKYFYPVTNAGHNNLYQVGGTVYFQRLKKFTETLQ